MKRGSKKHQRTLESTLGQPPVVIRPPKRQKPLFPPDPVGDFQTRLTNRSPSTATFMHGQRDTAPSAPVDSSSDYDEELVQASRRSKSQVRKAGQDKNSNAPSAPVDPSFHDDDMLAQASRRSKSHARKAGQDKDSNVTPDASSASASIRGRQPKKAAPVEPKKAAPVEPKKAAPVEPKKAAPVEPKKAAPVEPKKAAPVEPEAGRASNLWIRPKTKKEDNVDDDDEDEIVTSSSRKSWRQTRQPPKLISVPCDSSDSGAEPVDTPASVTTPNRRLTRKGDVSNSSGKRRARTEKQKQKEVLRRRRLGEKIDIDDLSSSDEEHSALYDPDPDHAVLDKFDDEEEGPEEPPEDRPSPPRRRASENHDDEDESDDDDLGDFIVEDHKTSKNITAEMVRAGVPVHLTSLANEPLKKYFKPAIESLIHRHLNPGIKSDNDALCTLAWKKLDKEPLSLANSKFISASWKSGFLAALVGCPRLECVELHAGDPMRYEACHACGRKKHPATWKLEFYGQPYDQDTLEPTDEDQSSDSNDDDGEDPNSTIERPGRLTRVWYVGVVCYSNAETSHSLLHWKHALDEYVELQLEDEGFMEKAKLRERKRMNPKQRQAAVEAVLDEWVTNGSITSLYNNFEAVLEKCRNRLTTR